MSIPGQSSYLGRTIGWIRSDFRRIVQRLTDVTPSGAEARLDDVPLLIKALSFGEEKIRADARECLTKLAGDDLGPEPAAWETWWDTKGKELRRQREEEEGLERLFAEFRGAVMEGRWHNAAKLLRVKIVTDGAQVNTARLIRRSKRALRQAYRDAGLEDIDINGEAAKLTVSWGRRGFEERELRARRDGDRWRFASVPWGRRIVKQPGKEIVQTKPARHIIRGPFRSRDFSAGGALMIACVAVWSVGILATLVCALFGSIFGLGWGPAIALSLAVCVGATALAVTVRRRHWSRYRRSHGDPMSFSYHPAGRPPGASARDREGPDARPGDAPAPVDERGESTSAEPPQHPQE